ncbi:MAG: insulinase family protein [candidate division KSB1 bacterium]|nr:insulinase family protein [candidate division KSB1 bacterium]MDZ7276514.1 insulinase family protein [candidate division KSB1 bacterium]MDZ7286705.1 insulinase family protein [candidate division KSB1 bacterium]MDZ7300284.1 insulinase family protein [candidate division KSB1 bacterium]MDZ7307885.1 insulinase family protein [candidate division KSB1 bacterium]
MAISSYSRGGLVLGALLLFALAQAQPRPGTGDMPRVEFEKYTLANGLQVILHVDRKLPIVHVNQWFHVGSKNEKPGRTGFAHLFEHMMFQGSKNAAEEYFTYVEKAGANLREGGVNGTTDNDRTNYFATVPSGNLELLLWVESDRLATLPEALTQAKLDNQRDVVKNERRQGLENQPYGRAFKLIVENLHPAGHPYSWTVIGSHEDLSAASLEDVKEFFRTYYTPNNLSLVIAGDFDPAEAKRLVEKYFGGIPPGPALDRPTRWIPRLEGEKIVAAFDRVPQARTYMVWPVPEYFSPEEAPLDLASAILTDGLSARLNKVLVYDRQLCTNVFSFNNTMEISGFFAVVATARPGVNLEQIENIVTAEISRLAKEGPTPAELKRAQTKREYNFVTGLERIGGFGGKADLLNQYNTYLGDPNKFEADVNRYRRVTVNEVRQAVATWLDTRNRLLVRFHPEASGRPAEVALDRSQQPALGVDKPFRSPEVKTAKAANGMEIFVVERPELPKVAVTFVTRAGNVADPPGKEGVANMVIATIDMGTKTRKALEIEDALGDLGTSLFGFATREASQLGLEVLSRHVDPALAILAEVIRQPVFPASEVDREKKRTLDNLAQQENNPNALAARLRSMLVFGHDHPYGRAMLPATVQQITREDLVAFHETYWKPGSSALIFVGDLTLAQATELVQRHFGSWRGGAAPSVSIPPPRPMAAGKIYLVDRQDAAQTVITQILPAPGRQTPDYYALRLADAVWGGGGFGTRLNLNLREDKGYSYGVFSNLALLSQAGSWWASGGVQTNKTRESVAEFLAELRNLAGARPISEKELEDARAARIRGYAQQFESQGRIASQIADLWAAGMPITELQRESDESARVTLAEVNAAAQKYAVPGQALLLLVGDIARIEAGLRELNAGELVVLNAEGKPVAAQ